MEKGNNRSFFQKIENLRNLVDHKQRQQKHQKEQEPDFPETEDQGQELNFPETEEIQEPEIIEILGDDDDDDNEDDNNGKEEREEHITVDERGIVIKTTRKDGKTTITFSGEQEKLAKTLTANIKKLLKSKKKSEKVDFEVNE